MGKVKIKYLHVWIFMAVWLLVMAGCESLKPQAERAANIAVKADYVNELVKSGAIADSLINSGLSDAEQETINVALAAYNTFTDKWGQVITKNPLDAITHTTQIINEYHVLRIRYLSVEAVVEKNWNKYPPERQYMLKEYQQQARELDDLVMSLLTQTKTTTALIAVQKTAVVLGQIALKLL